MVRGTRGPIVHTAATGRGLPYRGCMLQVREGSTPLVRTWFDDEEAWGRLLHEAVTVAQQERDEYADIQVVDDPAVEPLSVQELVTVLREAGHNLAVIADRRAMTEPGLPLLAVHGDDDAPEQMRIVASELAGFQVNVGLLSNVDWEDYASHVGPDGVYRGFR